MRVLVVEDDEAILASLRRNLTEEGYAVDTARDGKEGELLALVNPYDIVLLDVMLPRRSGTEVCKRLRQSNVSTPILMLTALDSTDDKIRGLDLGADDYLGKPYAIGELFARIRSLIRRQTSARSATIERFGVTLETNTHHVERDGIPISLSATEYTLLEVFMLNAGSVLSRERISDHLWDMNFEPRSNVVDSFVRFLRKKLDQPFGTPLIHTIRGVGYQFSEAAPRQLS